MTTTATVANEDENEDEDDFELGGQLEPPSLLQQRQRHPSLASSLCSTTSSWVELREGGIEALRLQVETEVCVYV